MAENNDSVTIQVLTEKAGLITKKLEELDEATRRGKWMGRFIIIAIAIVAALSLYRTFSAIRSNPSSAYAAQAADAAEFLLPVVQKNAETMLRNVAPVYEKAFRSEFEKAMPEISDKAGAELNTFLVHIGDNLEARLAKGIKRVVDGHLDALSKDHPELKDKAKREKVYQQAQEVYYSAAEGVAKDVFQKQTQALAQLGATLETFQIPDDLRKLNDEQLIERTKDTLLELLALRLSLFDDATTPPKAQAKPKQTR